MLAKFPYLVFAEKSVDSRITDILLDLKIGKKCAIFTDGNIRKIIADRICDVISEKFKTEIIEVYSIEKSYIESLSKRLSRSDFSIAIGGGRTIDITKYSSSVAGKPWVAFPTILTHDGIVSSRATLEDNGAKVWMDASEPAAIIADLNTIKNAPYRFLASGCGDLISNISAVNDWEIADKAGKEKYNPLIAGLSLLSADVCMKHAKEIKSKSYSGLENLLMSLVISGFAMNLYGSSRPCSGSEHNFSHALEKLLKENQPLHGGQVALGTITSLYLQKKSWEKTRRIIKNFGLPTTAKELGISDETAVKALAEAKGVRDRYTVLNKYRLTEAACTRILEKLEII